jgi:hypothetical protein
VLDTASPSRSLPLAGDADAFWRTPREALLAFYRHFAPPERT